MMVLPEFILSRLQHQHEVVDELTAGLTAGQIQYRINPHKWSIHENTAHLAAYQPVFNKRIKTIATENEPRFERYVAEDDPLFYELVELSFSELIKIIHRDRQSLLQVLEYLPATSLNMKGHHPRYGAMNLCDWIEFFLLHEAHHLFTIFMLTRDLRIMSKQ